MAAVAVKMQNDFFGESWILDEVAACGVRRRPASNDECGSVHLVKYCAKGKLIDDGDEARKF